MVLATALTAHPQPPPWRRRNPIPPGAHATEERSESRTTARVGDSWMWGWGVGCLEGRPGTQDNFWDPPGSGIPMLAKVSVPWRPKAFLLLEMQAATLTCRQVWPPGKALGVRPWRSKAGPEQGSNWAKQGRQLSKLGRQRGASQVTSRLGM